MLNNLSNTNTSPNSDLGLLVLRIIGGGLMLAHGIPKLMKLFKGDFAFADPIGIGAGLSLGLTVFAEFVCALLILVGLKSRLASIPLMITMLVAGLIVHGADAFGKKELALIYFGIYLAIFMLGSGKYSLDKMLQKD
jgi:putative oxidoreductase